MTDHGAERPRSGGDEADVEVTWIETPPPASSFWTLRLFLMLFGGGLLYAIVAYFSH